MEEEREVVVQELQRLGFDEVLWCGGANRGQDVTVRLVRAEDERLETLAMVKVHASHLMRCSKYFETCLSERWRERGSEQGALELSLEVHADVGCYTDCFSRMYNSSRNEFRNVKYSLELLKVASQVEYHELMGKIALYLSAVSWSEDDERRIREYAASPDFSRSHLEELVLRLGLNASKEEQQRKVCKQTWDVTLWGITNALDFWASPSFRKFVEELLEGSQVGTVNSIIVHAAKIKLGEFEKECQDVGRFMEVENFDKHVLGMCWILRLLLGAGVAEELVQCLLTLRTIPLYLVDAAECEEAWDEANAGCEFAQVVLQMYREVVAGRLLLRAAERVALLENWHELVQSYLFDHEDTSQATKDLFLTLPADDQVRLLNLQEASYSSFKFIDPRSLAALVKKNCLVVDGNNLHVMTEANPRQPSEHVSSDNFGDDDSRSGANAKRRKQRRNRRSQ